MLQLANRPEGRDFSTLSFGRHHRPQKAMYHLAPPPNESTERDSKSENTITVTGAFSEPRKPTGWSAAASAVSAKRDGKDLWDRIHGSVVETLTSAVRTPATIRVTSRPSPARAHRGGSSDASPARGRKDRQWRSRVACTRCTSDRSGDRSEMCTRLSAIHLFCCSVSDATR